jgi:hypothetical protein
MSAARRLQRDRDRELRRLARKTILAVAKARGCSCSPIVDVSDVRPSAISRTVVSHDHDCELLLAQEEGEAA